MIHSHHACACVTRSPFKQAKFATFCQPPQLSRFLGFQILMGLVLYPVVDLAL